MAVSMVGRSYSGFPVTLFLIIALLTLSPYSGMAENSPSEIISSVDELSLKPASPWQSASVSGNFSFEIAETSGYIHTHIGSFDPTLDYTLDAPLQLQVWRPNVDRLAIVQLTSNSGATMDEICSRVGCEILEPLPDSSWRLRINGDVSVAFAALSADEKVRWVGPEMYALRLHNSLLVQWDNLPLNLNLVALPAPDLELEELLTLGDDLRGLNVEGISCSATLCNLNGLSASNSEGMKAQLMALMGDGRLLFVEPLTPLRVLNAQSATVVGHTSILSNHNSGLDGSGETFAVLDTGLDSDHPDFNNRILSVRNSFSYDSSVADTNSGHGTHVTGTLVSDGGSYSGGAGLATQATVHVYALEYDVSGTIAKTGSTYDILRDASVSGARIGVNAWGSTVDLGQYNLESRSLDTFSTDYPDFLSVFAVGDDVNQAASTVAPPATAKNVLSIGASDGSAIANFSAIGPTLDGRIKPDLVAPGVGICSTRAEEALYPAGINCGTGTHANGKALYMSVSGTSPATAVASASAALMRQYIRTETSVAGSVSSDLIKAGLVNGAKDLGSADIPNEYEGWGQIDLENSMYPSDGATPRNTWFDNSQDLEAGFGFIYTFDIDSIHGVDISLVWTDPSASSAGSQTTSRLVNDLDLQLVAPDGSVWKGNVFSSGESIVGGVKDSTNNIERIRLSPGTHSQSGQWSVRISNAGGSGQSFALVVSANGSISPSTDLTVFDDSIITSQISPLVNDVITIQSAWINQAPLDSGSYRINLQDVTVGVTLLDTNYSNLKGGELEAVSIYHTFTTTGQHELQLTIDSDSQVSEINEANNIFSLIVNISATGLRLIPLLPNGSEPSGGDEANAAAINELNASIESELAIPIRLKHEGTSTEEVKLSVTNVQTFDPDYPNRLFSPKDTWTRSILEGDEFSMQPLGEDNDTLNFTLSLVDSSADLGSSPQRFARAGTFIVDLTARYQNQPLVSHSIRITVNVPIVDAVNILAAGVSNLQAEPGQESSFSISVRNTGNSISQNKLSCSSQHGWPVKLGPSQSSSIDFAPLDILEFLPLQVRLAVPPVINGSPAAGEIDMVTCNVTSENDPNFLHVEYANITVSDLKEFRTDLFDRAGEAVGPEASASPINVDTGEMLNISMTVSNIGNIAIPLSVKLQSASTEWGMYLTYSSEVVNDKAIFELGAGQSVEIMLTVIVPLSTTDGSQNAFSLTTKLEQLGTNQFITNGTTFIVGKNLGFTLEAESETVFATVGQWSQHSLWLNNTGNAELSLNWSTAEPPSGWQLGLDSAPKTLPKLDDTEVLLGVIAPNGTQMQTIAESIRIRVTGSYLNESVEVFIDLNLAVLPTLHFGIEVSSQTDIHDIERDSSAEIEVIITNLGNSVGSGNITAKIVDGDGEIDSDWTLDYESEFGQLAPGETTTLTIKLTPLKDAGSGLREIVLTVDGTAEEGIFVTDAQAISLGATAEAGTSSFDLYNLVPFEVFIAIILILPLIAFIGVRKLRINAKAYIDEGELLVAPGVHASQENLGDRRAAALMEDVSSEDDLISGDISTAEIQAALVQSIGGLPPPGPAPAPSGLPPISAVLPAGLPPLGSPPLVKTSAGAVPQGLPPVSAPVAPTKVPSSDSFSAPNEHPPIPAEGLPAGWTEEQWHHYGAEWLKRQGR